MKIITLRNIPPDLEAKLESEASASGASLAATVLRLLRAATGLSNQRQHERYHDLDELAGTWTDAEADEFERRLAEQRVVDPDLWV
jgi:hypothetical protein